MAAGWTPNQELETLTQGMGTAIKRVKAFFKSKGLGFHPKPLPWVAFKALTMGFRFLIWVPLIRAWPRQSRR